MPKRSSKVKAKTKVALQREVTTLRSRIDKIEWLTAGIYQFLGQANAPLRHLDAAAAIACGWTLPKNKELRRLNKREIAAIGKEFGTRG